MEIFDVYPVNDITIAEAKGSFVWDDKGTKYLDMYGGHAVIAIGHAHPHWVDRITTQLHKVAFYSNSVHIPIQKELASLLGKVSGKNHHQLFLCNSGAEANENAMKLASFHTGRKKIVAFKKAFHGRTSLAVAATDNPAIVAPVNETGNIIFIPFNDKAAVEKTFREYGKDIAAVIVEGIQGVGGIIAADAEFLKTIRECCTQHGALLIADEVQCGYGRTGKFFYMDHSGVDADIYSMAKGMGNGFPVGGILIAPHIKPKHGMLGTTFGGNHLACAAALGVLEVIDAEALMKNAETQGDYLVHELKQVNNIDNIRGAGLMIGFDVKNDFAALKKELLFNKHVFTGEAKPNVIRLLPSLALKKEEADMFLEALRSVV